MPMATALVFLSVSMAAAQTAAPGCEFDAAVFQAMSAADEARTDDRQDEWPEDPNRTRLILGATGRTLRQGEAYLDFIGVSLITVQAGVTDRLSVGLGTVVLIPGIRPLDVYWFTPKFQIYSGARTAAAVGIVHIGPPGSGGGVAYSAITRGSGRAAITAGVGYAYVAGGRRGVPVVQLGAELRSSRHVTLLTENYVGARLAMLSGGVRFIRGRRTLDLGMFTDAASGVAAPMIRWTAGVGPARR
jgi:hypothetical protein